MAGVVLLCPLLMVLGCAVAVTSGFPVLFRQTRVGRHGRDFMLYKLRTMRVRSGTEGGSFEPGSSSRVTAIGRLLRLTKLDELPQLWNVLRGDMSLVGPRPEVRKWVEVYPERWAVVLTVRPGITDPASIAYRDEESLLAASTDPETTYREKVLPRKLTMYEDYVQNRSFGGDLRILLRTLGAVLFPPAGGSGTKHTRGHGDCVDAGKM